MTIDENENKLNGHTITFRQFRPLFRIYPGDLHPDARPERIAAGQAKAMKKLKELESEFSNFLFRPLPPPFGVCPLPLSRTTS